ncbi:hypothetical protein EYF80_018142 [Liparis tanakae]|uniref:Uncharacterized protein n=1 Tax=Liparis tanakae TaxID=230148 RepID=A0A4Z2I0Y6_9TELE|nr:hypothetical protein EYF80_018142 [Liparis tanakae]
MSTKLKFSWSTTTALCSDVMLEDEYVLGHRSKSKILAPQWDIMAKRLSEAGRPSVSMQDEVHELD